MDFVFLLERLSGNIWWADGDSEFIYLGQILRAKMKSILYFFGHLFELPEQS